MECRNVSGHDYEICDPQFTQNPSANTRAIAGFFIASLIVLCIAGNTLVILLFYRYKRLRVVPNFFIVSLAFSDLLVGLVAMPIWLTMELVGWANLPEHINGESLSKASQFFDIFCCVSSIVNLTAVSIERFFSILKPLRHRSLMTPRMACGSIAVFWTYSSLLTFMQFVPAFDDHYLILVSVMGFFVPVVLLYTSYIGVFIAVCNRRNLRRTSSTAASGSTSFYDLSITKSLFIVTVVFTICWVPFFLFVLLYRYCLTCNFVDTNGFLQYEKFTKWMHYSNSAFNPGIYGMCNVNFRTALRDFATGCCCRRKWRSSTMLDDETQVYRGSFKLSATLNSESNLKIIDSYRIYNNGGGESRIPSSYIEEQDEPVFADDSQKLVRSSQRKDSNIIEKVRTSLENLIQGKQDHTSEF